MSSDIAGRFRTVADQFAGRLAQVPADAWDNPAPCDGWVTRDVVRHMVDWMPGFLLGSAGLALPEIPSVDADPIGAWKAVSTAIQAALDDPASASREIDSPLGRHSFERMVAMIGAADVLVHTWDLARAAGLDETLDGDEVHRTMQSMSSFDETLLRSSGQFGQRVDVADDADEQTKLLAYTGRRR